MSTTPEGRPGAVAYVPRDVCDAFRTEQRDANARTWQELRALRRLVILLVVGGHLFSGSVNMAGFGYWLDRHAAQPHPSTERLVAAVRAETRQDIADLRRELHDLLVSLLARPGDHEPTTDPRKGEEPCPVSQVPSCPSP